jgi:tetratricopeptide (TPR) repeat protein
MMEESVSRYRALNDRGMLARSLHWLGSMLNEAGDTAGAAALQEESLTILRDLGDRHGLMGAFNDIGEVARFRGDYPRAIALYEEGLAIAGELGVKHGTLTVNLGYAVLRQGDHRRSIALFRQGLVIGRDRGGIMDISLSLIGLAGNLGAVAEQQGNQMPLKRAARLLGAADTLLETMGTHLQSIDRLDHDRIRAAVGAALGEEAFGAAIAEGRALALEQAITCALEETISS